LRVTRIHKANEQNTAQIKHCYLGKKSRKTLSVTGEIESRERRVREAGVKNITLTYFSVDIHHIYKSIARVPVHYSKQSN